ncbi:MAG: TolC family protein [Elusimicrobiales bacterium]|jgi:outer membrane protein TolC
MKPRQYALRISAFIALSSFPSALFSGEPELSFEEASKLLLLNNPKSAAASASVESARGRLSFYRAGLYPQISAAARYNRAGGGLAPADESYSYGFSASQPLFAPALPAAVRSAEASYRKAEADFALVRSELLYNLKTVFSDLTKARETLELSAETLKRRAENVELIRIKYEAGRENKAALLETRAVYKASVWQNENYKKDLRLIERRLNRLLARPPMAAAPAAELPEPPAPPEDFGSFSGALERHPSLSSAQASLEISRAALDRSKSGFLPRVDADGNYTWSGADWPDKNTNWSAGIGLSLPLFAGGKLSADLASARADSAGAEAAFKDAKDEVYLAAEDAFLSWRTAWSFTDVARTSLESSEARAWLLRKQYLAGRASYFEWRNVEDQLISAENQLLAARRDLAAAHAAFIRSLGE